MTTRIRFSPDTEAPEGLYGRVVEAVGRARTRAARTRLALSSFSIAFSSVGSFFAVRATIQAASASGFTSFASLALTDTSIIARHAQEFFLSLIETMPSIEVVITLLGISIFLVSIRSFVRALALAPRVPLIRHS